MVNKGLIQALRAQFAEAGGFLVVVSGPDQGACDQEYENYLSSGCIPRQILIFKIEPGFEKAKVLTEGVATSN